MSLCIVTFFTVLHQNCYISPYFSLFMPLTTKKMAIILKTKADQPRFEDRKMLYCPSVESYANAIAELAEKALLYEVATTPKPGLVDTENSGAHKDMDLFTFIDSACALRGYFAECVRIGYVNKHSPADQIFLLLRSAGLHAEAEMYTATNGVNTHKGSIFIFGLICGACGIIKDALSLEVLMKTVSDLAQYPLKELQLSAPESARTGGEKQYHTLGVMGIRGEAAIGFPSVVNTALPCFETALDSGASLNDAGLCALLALMGTVSDSNILRRGGPSALELLQNNASAIQRQGVTKQDLQKFNELLVNLNLSPGGSADLLALTYFLHFFKRLCKLPSD